MRNFLKRVKTFQVQKKEEEKKSKETNDKAEQDPEQRYNISSLSVLRWISALISSRRHLSEPSCVSFRCSCQSGTDSLESGVCRCLHVDTLLSGHWTPSAGCWGRAELAARRSVCSSDKRQPRKEAANTQPPLSAAWQTSVATAVFIALQNVPRRSWRRSVRRIPLQQPCESSCWVGNFDSNDITMGMVSAQTLVWRNKEPCLHWLCWMWRVAGPRTSSSPHACTDF